MGIKAEGKGKEMERGSFAQPSITFSWLEFIWLYFFEIHSTPKRGIGTGVWRERGGEGGRKRVRREQHGGNISKRRERVIYGGEELPGSGRRGAEGWAAKSGNKDDNTIK